jgi:transposase InsO family protein
VSPSGELTDRPQRFFAAGIIRQKVFEHFGEEIPYSVAVVIEQVDIPDPLGRFLVVSCVQKGGSMGYKMRSIRYKKMVLEYARLSGSVLGACRYFEVQKSTLYRWKNAFDREGEAGFIRKKPIAGSHPRALRSETIEKVLHLRRTYHMGPQRIAWYLERYPGITTSCSTVYRTLIRDGMRRLPRNVGRRALHTRRYAKQVPGHHIQMDVKFLSLEAPDGKKVRRFEYTAIDDATRIRALRIYRHPVRTDRGHKFQAQFHWHVEDKGMRHVYIKQQTPQLNGKVERSHRSDREEFYQLLTYTDDVDLNKKLAELERFYNNGRPHGAFNGKTP